MANTALNRARPENQALSPRNLIKEVKRPDNWEALAEVELQLIDIKAAAHGLMLMLMDKSDNDDEANSLYYLARNVFDHAGDAREIITKEFGG